ncbi:MAG: hypothetical protein MJE68_04055 [Proteobacteria bacterium]|nr:hypothetical protein [Pseudomonadota bacterium]
MSKMLRTHQNTIGNLVIALLFVGGCIFLLTGSWDTSVSQAAKGCCGGDTTATGCCGSTTSVAATTGGCCGSAERVSDSGSYNCNCLETDNVDADCGDCTSSTNCGGTADTKGCQTEDPQCTDSCDSESYCDDIGDPVCPKDSDYNDEKGVCDGTPHDDGACYNNSEHE